MVHLRRHLAAFGALLALPFLNLPARAGPPLSGGGVEVRRNVNGAQGGASVSGGGFVLSSTVGEPSGGPVAGAGVALTPGYMTLAAQPGTVVSLSAVSKATGTLDLAWSAPGVDGFQGDVVSGFYRLDYSSDPAHAFSPTVFRTEFSTTVTAGSAQELELSGLLPNTTYYAKIYLADARKAFAEDSKRDDESTLANAPDPRFSSVFACSATVTWPLPAGGSEGFASAASSTNFAGGTTKQGATSALSFTLTGLSPGTSYYLRIANLNWQGDKNYSVIIATLTPSGTCLPTISGLLATSDAMGRSIRLTWNNPSAPAPQNIVVLMSTNTSESLTDGQTFVQGQTLPDGARVKSAGLATSLADGGLTLDTTYFYHVFTEYTDATYSVSVSTSFFLDLPPMTPANVTAVANVGRTAATVSWHSVASNTDGSVFKTTSTPIAPELAYYRVERSTLSANPAFVAVSTVAVGTQTYADAITGLGPTLLYRVVAVDSLGNQSPSIAVNLDDGSAYLFASDDVTHIKFSPGIYSQVLNSSVFGAADTVLRLTEVTPTDLGVRAVHVDAVPAVGPASSIPTQLPKADLQVVLSYAPGAGGTGPLALNSAGGARPAADATSSYSVYWNNGSQYLKLFGQVDPQSQTVAVNTAMTGTYEVRPLARTTSFDFDLSGQVNKVITPNGDHLNDEAFFIYQNPRDSAITGKVYDMTGGQVADMVSCPSVPPQPGMGCLQWDGKAGGRVVKGGVYVYAIKGEGKTFSGTIVVIR